MNTIKTFESFVSAKDSAKVNENPAVAMAAMSAADKMKEAYDAMKENAMEIDGDDSDKTAITEMCEMMGENAAMAAMAAKELSEMMKEVHVPGHEEESNETMKEVDTNESVVNEMNGFQSKALVRAVMKEAKPSQRLALQDKSRNINFLFTKMSDDAGWFCNTGPKEHKGKKVDHETAATLFGSEASAMGIELDGTPLTKFNYKFKGRDANAKVVGLTLEESLVTEAKLARGLKPLLTIGSTITKNAGEDALLDLSDKFDSIDDEYAGTIASHLDMAIELMQDGYAGDATKKLKQFNKACKDVLNGKDVGSAFE